MTSSVPVPDDGQDIWAIGNTNSISEDVDEPEEELQAVPDATPGVETTPEIPVATQVTSPGTSEVPVAPAVATPPLFDDLMEVDEDDFIPERQMEGMVHAY